MVSPVAVVVGGFAEFTMVDEHMVHKMPEGLTFEQGALVEPAAVALHAVRQSKLKAGDKAAGVWSRTNWLIDH